MPLFSKLYLHLVERNRKEIISYLVHSFGFVLFILFGIRGIVALFKESTDDSHESIQFSFMVCAGAVVLQATILFLKTVWSLENIMSKIRKGFANWAFVTTIGFFIFTISVINLFIVHSGTTKGAPSDNSQFSFMLCAGAVAIQTCLLYVGTICDLHDTHSKIALACLLSETVVVVVTSCFINFEEKYKNLLPFVQGLLPTFVIGSMTFMPLQRQSQMLNEMEKVRVSNIRLDEQINLVKAENVRLTEEIAEAKKKSDTHVNDKTKWEEEKKSMENEIKRLRTPEELEKKMTELEARLANSEAENGRLNTDLSKMTVENGNLKKDIVALENKITLHVDKIGKLEERVNEQKSDIRIHEKILETERLKSDQMLVRLSELTKEKERREEGMDRNCAELKGKLDSLKTNLNLLGLGQSVEDAFEALAKMSSSAELAVKK